MASKKQKSKKTTAKDKTTKNTAKKAITRDKTTKNITKKAKNPSITAVKKTVNTTAKHQRKITELKKELDNIDKKNKEKILIKDAHGQLYCQNENCDQPAVTDNFCRYHYLAGWPHIYARKNLLKENYLSKTIQELLNTFGESALLFIMQDCKNDKTFKQAINQMMLITANEEESINRSDSEY